MSGIIGSKINIRGSGRIAKLGTDGQVLTSGGAGVAVNYEDLAAGISWQSVVTGSTLTAVAGNGYWIDTTSNTCTITLPASASNGDTIIFADFDRTWGTNKIIIDSNGLKYQSDPDTYTVEYSTDGQAVKIVYSDATTGWIPILDKVVADAPVVPVLNDNGIFFAGLSPSVSAITNIVSNTGVVATDVAGVGTVRNLPADCEYGGDKGIFAFGGTPSATAISTLISNTGVVATDVSGVGSARYNPSACEYSADKDKGIFGFGYAHSPTRHHINTSNLVSNTGIMGTDVTGVGTARDNAGGGSFGNEKGIFGYGSAGGMQNMTNIVSGTGVVGTDVTGVGTARSNLAITQYGEDKAIFGYGTGTPSNTAITNLVSNTGVVATDTAGVGTARHNASAVSYA